MYGTPFDYESVDLLVRETNGGRGGKDDGSYQQVKLLSEYFLISICKLYSEVIVPLEKQGSIKALFMA